MRRRRALDGVRAVAALLVVVAHVAGAAGLLAGGSAWALLVTHGDIGVAVFFALSGLLLYRPWAEALLAGTAPPAAGGYLWRRVLRVAPAYWVVVLAGLPLFSGEHLGSVRTWAEFLTMTPIYDPHPWWTGTGPPGLYQLWSMAVEMSFYLALPPLAWVIAGVARGRARRALAAIGVLSAVSFAYTGAMFYPTWKPLWGFWPPHYLFWFGCGMAMAVLLAWSGHDAGARAACVAVGRSIGACWTIAALLFAIACTELTRPRGGMVDTFWAEVFKTLLYGLAAASFLAPVALHPASPSRLARLLGGAIPARLGRVSYGIFLWHAAALIAVARLLHLRPYQGPFGVLLAGTLLLTLPAAVLSHHLVERPAQRLRGPADQRRDDGAAQQLGDRVEELCPAGGAPGGRHQPGEHEPARGDPV